MGAEIEKLIEPLTPFNCKFFIAEWGFRSSKPAMDKDTVMHLYPYFAMKKPEVFKKIWKDAYPATKAAASVLTHLANVDTPLKAVLDGPAELMRLEVHGPKEENDKLKEALGPLGCVFYDTEWGFRNAVVESSAAA